MRNTYRILVAELILTTFISTTLIPSQILFAETLSSIPSDTTRVVTDTLYTTPSMDLLSTGSTIVSPVDSGNLATSDMTSSGIFFMTDDLVDLGSTGSGWVFSGSLMSMIGSSTGIVSTGASISTTDILIDKGMTDHETNIDLTDVSLKMTSHPTDTNPNTQILVQFKSDIDGYIGQYQVDQVENIHDLKTTETLSEQNIAVMEINTPPIVDKKPSIAIADFVTQTGSMDPALEQKITDKISELKIDPRVEHVQRNFVYTVSSLSQKYGQPPSRESHFHPTVFTGRTLPNNGTGFLNLWALDNQGQTIESITGTPDADIDYPEAMNYASGNIGTGVIVAVLDTGVAYNHPDLARHMWNGANCVSDTGATLGGCVHGYDFVNDDLDPIDDSGHGSHVAGTIGALSSTGGVTGVAPNVQIMAVKVLSKYAGGSTADIIRGINFATKNGAKVINASFGITQFTQSKSDFDYMTYQAIQNFPGLFVAAAGNNGMNTDGAVKSFPAGYGSDTIVSGEVIIDREQLILSGPETIPALQNVISVGATDQDDNLAPFSNYGTNSVQIAAPGVNIYSTVLTGRAVGIPQPISYANGWSKKVGANPNTWTTRSNTVVSGETIDISSVLWTDIRTPYVSGESSYIEKTIDNPNKDVAKVLITTWCDTPSTGDRIDILIANNGGLYSRVDYTNELYNAYEPTGRPLDIDGHRGVIAQYQVIANPDLYNATGSFDLRLKWVTTSSGELDGIGTNALSSYGCFVKDIQIDKTIAGGYATHDGTSMATPHVAGAAALAWSYRPGASLEVVRNAIIWGWDWKSQLGDAVQSGNRLNVLWMLQALEYPTISIDKLTLSGESGVRIKVRTTPEHMDAWQQIAISKDPQFSEQSGTIGYYLQQDSIGGNTFEFNNLTPDTTYYYQIVAHGILHSSIERAIPYAFHTPRLITQTGTGNVSSSGSVYLSGSTASGVSYGTGIQTIVLTESGASRVTMTLPLRGLTVTSSGSWDGIIQAPIQISSATGITVGTANTGVQSIYMIGSPDVSLSLTGSVAIISMRVTGANGTIFPVYRSDNAATPFIQIGSCTVAAGICTFTSDHFSLFAVGSPVAPIVISAPVSVGSTTGGGGGGSYAPVQNTVATQITGKVTQPINVKPITTLRSNNLTTSNNSQSTETFRETIEHMIAEMEQLQGSTTTTLAKKQAIMSLIQDQKKYTKNNGSLYRGSVRLEKETIQVYKTLMKKKR